MLFIRTIWRNYILCFNMYFLKQGGFALSHSLNTRAHNLWNFGCRAITINGIWQSINHWLFRKHSKYTHIVIFYKWIQLPRKSISRNERSQFIVENTSQWQKQSKAQDCPSRIIACWQIFLAEKDQTAGIPFSWRHTLLVCL